MVKNKIPLSTILGGFVLALSFLAGCIVFTLSVDLESTESDIEFFIFLGLFTFLCVLAAVTGIGLIRKLFWSRRILLLFFYLGLIGWTGFVVIRVYSNALFWGWRQLFGMIGFSIFVYAIFIAGILLLNNKSFKDEFPENEK